MVQDQKPNDSPSVRPDPQKPQWQRPVLIPLDLADAQAGINPAGHPDGAGCS
jgi:hypothetical protein